MASRKTGHRHHRKPWQARVMLNGKSISVGYHATEMEACAAEREFRRHHGLPPNLKECVDLLHHIQRCCDANLAALPLPVMALIDSALERFDKSQ